MPVVAERRGCGSTTGIEDGLGRLGELPIRTDTERNLGTALALVRGRRLTTYGALYVKPALRADAPLATVNGCWRTPLSPKGVR